MAKLIYILSPGHSGSTLLDVLLGTFPNVFSAGEFQYFTWQLERDKQGRASLKNKNICSCLERFPDCPIYSRVIKEINSELNINMLDNPIDFNTATLSYYKLKGNIRFKDKITGKIISFEQLYLKTNLFIKALRFLYKKQVKNVWRLIDTIGKITQSEYIVDSSKNITRFLLLKSYRPNDVKLIVNSRDNLGYVNSYLKLGTSPEKSLYEKTRLLKKINRLITSQKIKPFSTNYEEFVKDPERMLIDFSKWIHIKYDPNQLKNIDTRDYHLVAGNPMRYKGKIEIKYDNKWERELDQSTIIEINSLVEKFNLKN